MKENVVGFLLKYVPKNIMSYLAGRLVMWELPQPFGRWLVSWFAAHYRINVSEAELPLKDYKSIGSFFTRKLRPGVRQVEGGVIHPVDGKLTEAGTIRGGTLIQAKGRDYTAESFLSDKTLAAAFEDGVFATYYLCPTDYHRVHSPVTGVVERVIYIPGYLWPVNPWSVRSIDRLFSINERVVISLRTPRGRVCVVMVGATNVGRMTLSFDPSVVSNAAINGSRRLEKTYDPAFEIKAGDELGVFNMGSTVIVLYEKGVLSENWHPVSGPTHYGSSIYQTFH